MQYMNTIDLTMLMASIIGLILMVSPSVPNEQKILINSIFWFPVSLGLYLYNKFSMVENGIFENIVFGVGFFSFVYICIFLFIFFKRKKSINKGRTDAKI